MLIDLSNNSQLTRVGNNPHGELNMLLIEEIALDMSYDESNELRFESGFQFARLVITKDIPLEAWTGDEQGVHLNQAEAYILGQTKAIIVYSFSPEFEDTIEIHFYTSVKEAKQAWAKYVNTYGSQAIHA